jgi:hypothetical protein
VLLVPPQQHVYDREDKQECRHSREKHDLRTHQSLFLSRTGATGCDLFGYLTTDAQGSSTLNVNVFTPGDATEISLGALALSSPAAQIWS